MQSPLAGSFVVILLSAYAVAGAELPSSPDFNAEVRFAADAIEPNGFVNLGKVLVFVRPRQANAQNVNVYGTLERTNTGGWQVVGSFVCGVGDVSQGQTVTYSLASCSVTPTNFHTAVGRKHRVTLEVRTATGRTLAVVDRVRRYPPGPRIR